MATTAELLASIQHHLLELAPAIPRDKENVFQRVRNDVAALDRRLRGRKPYKLDKEKLGAILQWTRAKKKIPKKELAALLKISRPTLDKALKLVQNNARLLEREVFCERNDCESEDRLEYDAYERHRE
jgi:DNA-binding Xre family transcriptional regulator